MIKFRTFKQAYEFAKAKCNNVPCVIGVLRGHLSGERFALESLTNMHTLEKEYLLEACIVPEFESKYITAYRSKFLENIHGESRNKRSIHFDRR